MNIIAVDDERIALRLLMGAIQEALPEGEVHGFDRGEEALAFGREHPCDIAFLDIQMHELDGISLAKQLKKINPKVNIIFVTAHQQYTLEAFTLHSSGYLLKPPTPQKIANELENLRHPVAVPAKHRVWIQCFGNFEVFADGEPIKFTYSKTKEVLAFLVDRGGAFCSNGEIIAALWEDADGGPKKNSYLRDLRADLINTLSAWGAGEAIRKRRGEMAVCLDKISCDYYDWMQGDIHAINAYRGEYMSQYSWSEFTLGGISVGTP